jgi:hypothetical protein
MSLNLDYRYWEQPDINKIKLKQDIKALSKTINSKKLIVAREGHLIDIVGPVIYSGDRFREVANSLKTLLSRAADVGLKDEVKDEIANIQFIYDMIISKNPKWKREKAENENKQLLSIPLSKFSEPANIDKDELKKYVHQLADTMGNRVQTYEGAEALELLNGLRNLLLRAVEQGIHEEMKTDLNKIRVLCDRIIRANPASMPNIPSDLLIHILSHGSVRDAITHARINTKFKTASSLGQIKAINRGDWLVLNFPKQNASEIIDWIIKNPHHEKLTFVNFYRVPGFDNDCLKKLIKHCPNLTHLVIPYTEITAEVLKYLSKGLKSLNIKGCNSLVDDLDVSALPENLMDIQIIK